MFIQSNISFLHVWIYHYFWMPGVCNFIVLMWRKTRFKSRQGISIHIHPKEISDLYCGAVQSEKRSVKWITLDSGYSLVIQVIWAKQTSHRCLVVTHFSYCLLDFHREVALWGQACNIIILNRRHVTATNGIGLHCVNSFTPLLIYLY